MATERSPYIGLEPVKEYIIQSFLNDVSLGNLTHIPVGVFEATASQATSNLNTRTIFNQFNICVFRLQYCERLKTLVPINPELENKIKDEFQDFKEEMEQQRLRGPIELVFRNLKAHPEYKRKKHFFDEDFYKFVNQDLHDLVYELKWKKPPRKSDRNDLVDFNLINMPPTLLDKVRRQFDEVSNQIYDFHLINVKDVNWENGPTVTHYNRICYFTRLYHIISGKHKAFVDKMDDEALGNMELLSTCIYGFDILPVGHFMQRYLYKNLGPRLQQSRISDTQRLPIEYIRKTLDVFSSEAPLLFQFIQKYLYDNRNANAERLDFLGRLQRMQQESVKEEADRHRVCAKYADIAALERMVTNLTDDDVGAVGGTPDDGIVILDDHFSTDPRWSSSNGRAMSPTTAELEMLRAMEGISLTTPDPTAQASGPSIIELPDNYVGDVPADSSSTQQPLPQQVTTQRPSRSSRRRAVATPMPRGGQDGRPRGGRGDSQGPTSQVFRIAPSTRNQSPPGGGGQSGVVTDTDRLDQLFGGISVDPFGYIGEDIPAGHDGLSLQQPLFLPFNEQQTQSDTTVFQPVNVDEHPSDNIPPPVDPFSVPSSQTQTRQQTSTQNTQRVRPVASLQPRQSILRDDGAGGNTSQTRTGRQTFRLRSPVFRAPTGSSADATVNNTSTDGRQTSETSTRDEQTQQRNREELARLEAPDTTDEAPSQQPRPYSPPPWARRPYRPTDTSSSEVPPLPRSPRNPFIQPTEDTRDLIQERTRMPTRHILDRVMVPGLLDDSRVRNSDVNADESSNSRYPVAPATNRNVNNVLSHINDIRELLGDSNRDLQPRTIDITEPPFEDTPVIRLPRPPRQSSVSQQSVSTPSRSQQQPVALPSQQQQSQRPTQTTQQTQQQQQPQQTQAPQQTQQQPPSHVNLFLPESHNRPVMNPFDPNFVGDQPPLIGTQPPRGSAQQRQQPPASSTTTSTTTRGPQLPQQPQPSPKPKSRGFRDYRRSSMLSGGRVYHTDGSSTTDDSSDNSWSDESRRSRRKPSSRVTSANRPSRSLSADDGPSKKVTTRRSPHSTAAPSGATTSKQATDVSALSGMGSLNLGSSPTPKTTSRSSSLQTRTRPPQPDFMSRDPPSSSSIDVLSMSDSMNSRTGITDTQQSGPSSLPTSSSSGSVTQQTQATTTDATSGVIPDRQKPKFFMRDAQKMFRMVDGKPKLPPMKSSWFSSGDEEGLECLRTPRSRTQSGGSSGSNTGGGQARRFSLTLGNVLSGKSGSQQAMECLDNVMNHAGEQRRYALKGQSAAPADGDSSYVPLVTSKGTTYYKVQRRASSQDRSGVRPQPRQNEASVGNLIDFSSSAGSSEVQTPKTLSRSSSFSSLKSALSRQGSSSNIFAPQQRPSTGTSQQQSTVPPQPLFTASAQSKSQTGSATTGSSSAVQTQPGSSSTVTTSSAGKSTTGKKPILTPASFTPTSATSHTLSGDTHVAAPPTAQPPTVQPPATAAASAQQQQPQTEQPPDDDDPLRALISQLDGSSITSPPPQMKDTSTDTTAQQTPSQPTGSGQKTGTTKSTPLGATTSKTGGTQGGSKTKQSTTSQEKKDVAKSSTKKSPVGDKTKKGSPSSGTEPKSKSPTKTKSPGSKASKAATTPSSGQTDTSNQVLNASVVTIDGANIHIEGKASVFAPTTPQTVTQQQIRPPSPKPTTRTTTQTTNIFSAPIPATCPAPTQTSASHVGTSNVLPGAEHIFLPPVDDAPPPPDQQRVHHATYSATASQNVLPGAEHIFLPPQEDTVDQPQPQPARVFAQQIARHSTEELRTFTQHLRQQISNIIGGDEQTPMEVSTREVVEPMVISSGESAAPTPRPMELGSTPTNFMDTS
ncbi:ORF-C [Elephant endotheliotropic herpesvirus 2]|nr:ORF-C [Elephant endotheliotropic herpesvirus 2]UEH20491.1 ORF-C [Elephant endotheliotropic herpesvirus 2]